MPVKLFILNGLKMKNMQDTKKSILKVNNLSVDFCVEKKWRPAVSNLSFSLYKSEILAIVGESGCGKSVTCLSLGKLIDNSAGRYSSGNINLYYCNKKHDILSMSKKELRKIRGKKIAYIFQEPSVSLNPVYRVGEQVAEAIIVNRNDVDNIEKEVVALFEMVGIPEPTQRIFCYPHELSGGMQQRVMIAMALAGKPDILVADEPTTALDVTIQAQILQLLSDIRTKTGMSIIIVTHNLGIVAELADRVIVMYAGQAVEEAKTEDLFNFMHHPYTRALLSVIPRLGQSKKRLKTIPGTVPSPDSYPKGCRYYERCDLWETLNDQEKSTCINNPPCLHKHNTSHFNRCHFWYLAK
jgi:peptide/nickel transport system ATP-binding protein